jgi:cytoskeletal protein CcmA (bactofilin family)
MSNQSDSLESVVIGDGVVVKGTFTVPSKAVVNGVIEGDLTAEEVLIGPTGRITGRVSAKVIDVRGQLHNTIISEKNLIVRSTGKIAGKVHYSEIEIEKGGEIEGSLSQDSNDLQALESSAAQSQAQAARVQAAPASATPASAPASAPAPAAPAAAQPPASQTPNPTNRPGGATPPQAS